MEICQCCGSEIRKYKGTFKSGPNYTISQDNRSVTKCSSNAWDAIVIGSENIAKNAITIINYRIELTNSNSDIMFGLSPKTINQKGSNLFCTTGWYFYSCTGGLYCQSPLSYNDFSYSNEKKLPSGTVITMIVDTTIGKISYKINGGEVKTAYHALTFDEPIVPCVMLYTKGDTVRLIYE